MNNDTTTKYVITQSSVRFMECEKRQTFQVNYLFYYYYHGRKNERDDARFEILTDDS